MKLPNPIKSTTRQAVINHLRRKRQLRLIGSGTFARVYGRAKRNRVVKVGHGCDKYLNYVSIIGLKNPNPYFPTIYSIKRYQHTPCAVTGWTDWKDNFYLIEMEKLTRWSRVPAEVRERLLSKIGCRDIYEADDPKLLDSSSRWEREAIRSLRRLWSNNRVGKDVHMNNIMFRKVGRDWQLVYTDPAA